MTPPLLTMRSACADALRKAKPQRCMRCNTKKLGDGSVLATAPCSCAVLLCAGCKSLHREKWMQAYADAHLRNISAHSHAGVPSGCPRCICHGTLDEDASRKLLRPVRLVR